MRILADENMPAVAALFGDLSSSIVTAPGRTLTADQVSLADVLLVRSVTPVNAALLARSELAFVGSATIGTDHIDHTALVHRGIPFAHAPGCNADAVVDYVFAALLHVFRDDPAQLAEKSLAVIGAGNVGGRLVQRARALGLTTRVCDPPRARQEGTQCEAFVDLDVALSSDVVCCHTPLTDRGDHPTRSMLTAEKLAALPKNAVFINAGRGGIVATPELQRAMAQRPDVHWVLDVWDPEPAIPRDLLPQVALATGHIAGYSSEGKVRGTWMLRQALAKHLNLPPTGKTLQDLLPPAPRLALTAGAGPWHTAARAVQQVYDISADDARFRAAMAGADHGVAFDHYRRTYPQRREYHSTAMATADRLPAGHAELLSGLGFKRS